MGITAFVGGIVLIFLILRDGLEAMVIPRRIRYRFRFTPHYYRAAWSLWRALARRLGPGKRRESLLSLFGPLSLLGLISLWMVGLLFGFALLHWGRSSALSGGLRDFGTYCYLSGVTLFTLGYGDVTPTGPLGRVLAVVEAGMGFGFLAVVIGYLPVLYQAFSRREVSISLLDARAGSPPSAAQVLLRLANSGNLAAANPFLAEWERWSAELLESHLSFPALSYYRSQHDNQSWLAALTAILDTCALVLTGAKNCKASGRK